MKKHLVIARYKESLDWLDEIDCVDKTFIYNKGNERINDDELKLPNVGREAHTFCYHIVNNYDDLADITIFVQGNPFEHIKDKNLASLNSFLTSRQYSLWKAEPLLNDLVVDFARHTAKCYEDCLQGDIPDPIMFSPGAQWIVPKNVILSKSKKFFINILRNLSFVERTNNTDGIYNAWNMEGMWNYIFNVDTKEKNFVFETITSTTHKNFSQNEARISQVSKISEQLPKGTNIERLLDLVNSTSTFVVGENVQQKNISSEMMSKTDENINTKIGTISEIDEQSKLLVEKKNLVLGAASNIELESIKVFLKSFRKHNDEADIFLLVETTITDEKRREIEKNGAHVIFSSTEYFLKTPINNTRYIKFYEFLEEKIWDYQNILISDVRDVYFQGNPFSSMNQNCIMFAQEEETKTISGDCNFNARWIQQTYGESVYQSLHDKKITCCGTILGSSTNMQAYLKFMVSEISRFLHQNNPFFDDMLDTAIHTYSYYMRSDLFKNPVMNTNGDIFGTVGLTIIECPEKVLIKDGKIEINRQFPSIIHQYDRSPWLTSFIKNNCK